jgi:hypothetical protein
LKVEPDDGRGWEVIAPIYQRLGRFKEAVAARRNALGLLGETSQRQSDLGEALLAAANGTVTAEAKTAFERAVALNGGNVKGRSSWACLPSRIIARRMRDDLARLGRARRRGAVIMSAAKSRLGRGPARNRPRRPDMTPPSAWP